MDGRYEFQGLLGTGGMASVYQAYDHQAGQSIALKLLLPEEARSERTRTRFLREARTMAQLDHPCIVRVNDVGVDGDRYFFTMELCRENLAHHLRASGPQHPSTALRYMLDVLSGLYQAHTAGVVHRDVKPHNMLFGQDGRIKLTDFGIARVIDSSGGSRITGTGDTLGTLAYMAPEQRMNPRRAGPPADLFGVGATLYVLVTGRRPLDLGMAGIDPLIMEQVPSQLRSLIRVSTAHRPEDRYPDARSMAADFVRVWEELSPDLEAATMLEQFDSDADGTIIRLEEGSPLSADNTGESF